MVKLDFRNAFKILQRDYFLEKVAEFLSEIFHLAYSAYGSPSNLSTQHFFRFRNSTRGPSRPSLIFLWSKKANRFFRVSSKPVVPRRWSNRVGDSSSIGRHQTGFRHSRQKRPKVKCLYVRGIFERPKSIAETSFEFCFQNAISADWTH